MIIISFKPQALIARPSTTLLSTHISIYRGGQSRYSFTVGRKFNPPITMKNGY